MKCGLLFFIAGTVLVCSAYADKFEPSVAFVCDRGSMHMHKDGSWESDPKTDCMEGKAEILSYCKKMYPALEITNIVESSDYKRISGWCAVGKTGCGSTEAFKVRAYRCLTGPFQSDALIVPKACVFDHIHEPKQCHSFDWWRDVAHKACRGIKHMKTESYAMLLPCGTDVFTGVEYVCCPDGNGNSTDTSKTINTTQSAAKTPAISVKVEPSALAIDAAAAELKTVNKYMSMKEVDYKLSEHSAFTVAKNKLLKLNHDKVTKLMKDWAEARQRVLDLKQIDPKGAEKMNKEITPRFQKEYFALQSTSDSKTLRLDAVHQQHVQANMDAKKRRTIEKLMHELQSDQPEPASITKFLKRYISIEEKDAHHCIHHYTKIRSRDASAGRQMLPATITHLTLIGTRINQSIGLLDTLDNQSLKTKIRTAVDLWRSKTFNSLQAYIDTFKKEILANDHVTKVPRTTEKPEDAEILRKKEEQKKPVIFVSEKKPDIKQPKGLYKKYASKFAAANAGGFGAQVKPAKVDEEDEKEDEHKKVNIAPKLRVNHLAKGAGLSLNANAAVLSSNTVGSVSGMSVGTALAVAFGVLAAVLVVVFTVVMSKKRSSRGKPAKESYMEVSVDDGVSAEDRHIASMQNGYENPTYMLLEKRAI